MEQLYGTAPSRLSLSKAAKMLQHAEPIVVLGDFGQMQEMPENETDTLVYRRYNPYSMNANGTPNITATAFALQEGVTPNAQTLAYTDGTVTLQQFGVLFQLSSTVEKPNEHSS